MAKEYSQAFAEYEISRERFLELKHKCLQYPEWIRNRNDCYGLSSGGTDGMPKGSGGSTSVVERQADRARKYAELVDIVERCLFEATDGNDAIIPYLRKNICYGIPYISLSVPCDKNKFTKYRHKFYYILDKKT